MTWIRDRLGPDCLSERRAYRVLGQPRSTQSRVREVPKQDAKLVGRMVELASEYGRYGYRRITAMLPVQGALVTSVLIGGE